MLPSCINLPQKNKVMPKTSLHLPQKKGNRSKSARVQVEKNSIKRVLNKIFLNSTVKQLKLSWEQIRFSLNLVDTWGENFTFSQKHYL